MTYAQPVSIESLESRQMLSASIAMFFDPKFVNTAANSDSQNLLAQVQYAATQPGPGFGNTIKTFVGTTQSAFASALGGANLLLIPSLDNGDLNAVMTNATRDVIRNFLNAGGGLISVGNAYDHQTAFLDNTFNYASMNDNGQTVNYYRQSGAANTAFANGPAQLSNNAYMYPLWNLPAGANVIYTGNGYNDLENVTLATLPYGNRNPILFFGWDFSNGGPNGTQDGGWNTALALAIKQVAGSTPTPTPYALTASPLNQTTVNLTWKSSTINVTGFVIQRAAGSAGPWKTIGQTVPGVTTFASAGLSAATQYVYRVYATGPFGNGANSNTASATTFSSVFATLASNGALSVAGTNDNDTIAISLKGGTLTVQLNALTQTFVASQVKSITLTDKVGNNTFAIGAGVGAVSAIGGSGNDTFVCLNTAPDTLTGGGGNDTLFGNAKDVTIGVKFIVE